jgi:hypothetical protein
MTLLETERLVRKISELLKQEGNPAIAPKLAEDFAAACHAVNLRLQQCEAMIKAGDRQQAIQLGETAPNLLDIVTVLEFNGSDNWRGYCQQNSLPAGDRIDARAVRALNECYAQGITTDHPLYAAYRSAVLSHSDEDALKALQSITRLNPTDANAAGELARLDGKVLGARLQHLATSLKAAGPAQLVAEIENIEAFGFKSRPENETWRQAQVIRCGCLLEESAKLKSTARWVDVLAKLDFVRRLQDEFKLELPPSSLKQLEILEGWARGEQEKDKKDREFQSCLAELRYRILQSEEKDTSARYVELRELRNDYEGLNKVWRALADFTRPIPEEAASDFRKRSGLLEAEIARRTSIRRRVILASSMAVLVIGAVVVWFVMGQLKARDFAKRLQEATTQQQTRTAETLLERLRAENRRLSEAGNVTVAAAAAETFVARERALLANFESAFTKLPQQLPAEPNATRVAAIADQLILARGALDALAPDLKTENQPRLETFEKQWQTFLSASSTAVNAFFEQEVIAAEKQCNELDYRAPMEKSTAQLAVLSNLVQQITECESGFTNHLSFRGDLLERSVAVRAKFTAYAQELKKLEDGMAAIRKARTIHEFSDGINLIASSEFSASPAAAAAVAVQSLSANETTTLRILLRATNASTWAYVGKEHAVRFVPEVEMPAEQMLFKQLNHDPAISANHQRSRLWLDAEGTRSVEWITVGGFDTTVGWKNIEALLPSSDATSAVFSDRQYGFFDGLYKLTPTEPIYRIEWLGDLHETASFYSVGLQQMLAGDSYTKSLLEVLDAIKDSRQGSPLFRAYLFVCLSDLMRLQPDAWGFTFCPALGEHELQLENIVGGKLNSGDWFVTAKVNAYGGKLDEFFVSKKAFSYAKQAAGLLTLMQAASKNGLIYAGFVGLDGKPNFIDTSGSGEVWGYSAAAKQPVLVAGKIDAGTPLRELAMPLSPLFALANPCKEYLAQAKVIPDDDCFRGVLPPLFRDPMQLQP